jgi:hypothetical protein
MQLEKYLSELKILIMDIRINIKHLLALLILLTSSIGYSQSTTTTDINSLSFPQLSIKNDTVGIQISSMHVAIKTMGNIAITSYDITFYNPSMRLLEGELNFPLKANQQIVDFSMDVNGQLRKGVVVEKNKGQRVFETIVREGIDPGLLEKTKGNNFRLRIYPIMAQSSKRIIITCQEEMVMNGSSYQFLLPMDFNQLIDQFSVEMEVIKGIKKPNILKDELADIRFKKWNDSYIAQASMKKFKAKGLLSVQLPVPKKKILKLSSDDGRYFYATMPLNIDPQKKNRIEHLDIVWDISGSGIKRNIQKELDLLSAYLKKQGDSNVTLTTFNHICDASKHFKIRDGQVATLINHLKALHYDGGSRINNINFNQFKGQEILLFTDGLTTLGDLEINLATKPVNIINSSLSANHLLLQQLAQKNQGNYIDLSTLDNPTALNMLDEQVIHVNCEALNGQLNEVITQISPDKKMLLVTGKKQTAQATVAINVLQGNQVLNRQSMLIENQEKQHTFPVNRLWASQKIKRLMANKKRNKPEIIAIAKKYGVVTDYTSLLVLERLEDYIRFEVEPPVEWMAEYQQAIDQKHKQYRIDSDNNNALLQAYIREYKKWWNTNYPLTKKPPFGFRKETMEEEIVPITRQQETAPPPPPAVSSTLNIVDDDTVMEELVIEDTEMDEDCEIDFTDLSMNEEDRIAILFLGIGLGLFSSCDNDDPKEKIKPSLTITSPAENQIYTIGDNITLTATATDNSELMRLEHEILRADLEFSETAYRRDFISLDGKNESWDQEVLYELKEDNAKAGQYNIKFTLIDAAHNVTEVIRSIQFKNPDITAPTIEVTKPFNDSSYQPGQELTFSGSIRDDEALKELRITITSNIEGAWNPDIKTIELSGHEVIYSNPLPLLTIPNDAKAGEYLIELTAIDMTGNRGTLVNQLKIGE